MKFKNERNTTVFLSQLKWVPLCLMLAMLLFFVACNDDDRARVRDPLTLSSFLPLEAYPGDTVSVNGSGFGRQLSELSATINQVDASVVALSEEGDQLQIIVPEEASSGAIEISIEEETVQSSTELVVRFLPVLTGFVPASGPIGTKVEVRGENFGLTKEENVLMLGDLTVDITDASDSLLTFMVPEEAETGRITVTVNEKAVTSEASFTVTEIDMPMITDFSPKEGRSGSEITITGENFPAGQVNDVRVIFGDVPARAQSQSVLATSISCLVPGLDPGSYVVSVAFLETGDTLSFAESFVVPENLTITSFSPLFGTVGEEITIEGTSLPTSNTEGTVTFGGGVLANIDSERSTETQVVVTVPSGAEDGPITITFEDQEFTSTELFDVVLPFADITGISPDAAPVGFDVAITGTNFVDDLSSTRVYFINTSEVAIQAVVDAVTSTEVRTSVPAGLAFEIHDIWLVVEKAGDQIDSVQSPIPFTVNETMPPVITEVNITSGEPGDVLVITGEAFGENPIVSFAGNITANIQSSSETSITVTVPDEALTGPVTVTKTPANVSTSSDIFTMKPVITNLPQANGNAGDELIIQGQALGSNFVAMENIIVTIGGLVASVRMSTATELIVEIPDGGTNRQTITVAINGVTSEPSNVPFIYNPLIESSLPLYAFQGNTITISGQYFSGTTTDNIVTIGGVSVSVAESSETEIKVNMPVSGGTISIQTPGSSVIENPEISVRVSDPIPSLAFLNATILKTAIITTVPEVNTTIDQIASNASFGYVSLEFAQSLDRLIFVENEFSFVTLASVGSLSTIAVSGGGEGDILTGRDGGINGFTLDESGGKIYWVENDLAIFESNLDGTGVNEIYDNEAENISAEVGRLRFDGSFFYFITQTSNETGSADFNNLVRVSSDGEGTPEVLYTIQRTVAESWTDFDINPATSEVFILQVNDNSAGVSRIIKGSLDGTATLSTLYESDISVRGSIGGFGNSLRNPLLEPTSLRYNANDGYLYWHNKGNAISGDDPDTPFPSVWRALADGSSDVPQILFFGTNVEADVTDLVVAAD